MAKHREKMHVLFEQLCIYDALFVCKPGDSTVIILRENELSNPASSSECKGTSLIRGEGRIPKGSSGGTGHQK